MKITLFSSLASLLAFVGMVSLAQAQTIYTWHVDANGNWNDPDNWLPSTGFPNGVGDEVIFDSSVTTLGRTITQNVADGVILSRLVFDSTGGARATTINNNAIIFEAATPGGFAELYATGNPGGNGHSFNSAMQLNSSLVINFQAPGNPTVRKGSASDITGASDVDLIKRGVGTFSILGTITFEGRMISEGGRIWITESGGNALNVSRYIVRNDGVIEVGSGRNVNLQRLNTNAVMELHQGRFQSSGDFQNTDAVNTTQQTGNILLSGGLNAISINYANNNGTALTTNSVFAPTLTRDNNATLLVRGRNLGIPATGTAGASAFYFTDTTFNTTLTNQLVGGEGLPGQRPSVSCPTQSAERR
jgi:hypothetical protein